ncbi:DUF6542 domain-containing protein [Rhodococcus kronopolitis]|uniref:DUF6542 domain-containing protein n=1 Tax=Rhodococcus kronopolitis TaxID=1460226 RepID=A0ABV9FWE8_9NOCA
MSATQRARSGVPLDARSVVPTVPGVPAWGAVLIAAGTTFVGFVIDALRGTELTSAFAVFYFLGCVAAVLAVRGRALFTALVQPPLILVVAVPLAYQMLTVESGGGLKGLVFNIALPLVNRFPMMMVTTLVVAAIAGCRYYLNAQARVRPARAARGGRTATESPATASDRSAGRTATGPNTRVPGQPSTRPQPTRRPRSGDHLTGARPRSVDIAFEETDQFDRDRQFDHEQTARRAAPAARSPRQPHRTAPEPVPVGEGRPGRPEAARQYGRLPGPDGAGHPLPQVRYRDRHDEP